MTFEWHIWIVWMREKILFHSLFIFLAAKNQHCLPKQKLLSSIIPYIIIFIYIYFIYILYQTILYTCFDSNSMSRRRECSLFVCFVYYLLYFSFQVKKNTLNKNNERKMAAEKENSHDILFTKEVNAWKWLIDDLKAWCLGVKKKKKKEYGRRYYRNIARNIELISQAT